MGLNFFELVSSPFDPSPSGMPFNIKKKTMASHPKSVVDIGLLYVSEYCVYSQ